MRLTTVSTILASIAIALVGVNGQTCLSGRGVCEYTKNCKAPAYSHIPGHCPGPADFQCCVWNGCVDCDPGALDDGEETRGFEADIEKRLPCC
ncbi:hypothetical protein C8F01DRAFT_1244061 [Mycena amicta]|nr:hypothetical protein C8F01DRAFT_1244061 [Mycena amicta]